MPSIHPLISFGLSVIGVLVAAGFVGCSSDLILTDSLYKLHRAPEILQVWCLTPFSDSGLYLNKTTRLESWSLGPVGRGLLLSKCNFSSQVGISPNLEKFPWSDPHAPTMLEFTSRVRCVPSLYFRLKCNGPNLQSTCLRKTWKHGNFSTTVSVM